MDSITQIVLGAAAGEIAAGRKLGNRAMIWGALAGTLPDLDVTAGMVADPITNLAFHRCVTHSLYYAALASPLLAWATHALYPKGKNLSFSWLYQRCIPAFAGLYALIVLGSIWSPTPLRGYWTYAAVVAGSSMLFPLMVWGFRQLKPRSHSPKSSYSSWLGLFLLAIGTHPLLDCFTTYGTQVLQPFDDLRIAWNTISVVDPAYTLPFALCLVVASRMLRSNRWRRHLTWLGLGISSVYLAITAFNHSLLRKQVAQDLAAAGLSYDRFMVTPTLFQNILWNVTVDQGDTLSVAQLGFLDEPFELSPKQFRAFPRQDFLLDDIRAERAVQVAEWFSDGYYVVEKGEADTLLFMDLRFGVLPVENARPVFAFQLFPGSKGQEWGFRQNPFRSEMDPGLIFSSLWTRIKGQQPEAVPLSKGM